MRGAEVVPFDRHPLRTFVLTRPPDQHIEIRDQIGVVRRMSVAQQRGLAAQLHLVFPVLTQRLQQPVAHAQRAPVGQDHRLVDQRAHEVDDVEVVERVEPADRLCST